MNEYIVALIVCFACAIYAGIRNSKAKPESPGIIAALEHDCHLISANCRKLQFRNDELLMDNKILAGKVKRLENSNAQLQRRPRA